MTDRNHIELRSDNAAPVAPAILDAVLTANKGTALAYGGDELTGQLESMVRTVFEHDRARVFPVTSGTAANALALTAMMPPWGAVLCNEGAHIIVNEGGATSMFGAGAVMHEVGGDNWLIDVDRLQETLEGTGWGDPHRSQPAVLSLTQTSDFGTVYTADEIRALTEVARRYDMRCHIDGARLANAIAALGCSPADMTWRAGIDALTLGATKNGAMSAEAIVVFDDEIADQLVYRTKRAGHVTSKMRFQSAQLIAYLTDGYWIELAANSNHRMTELVSGLRSCGGTHRGDRYRVVNRVDANMVFIDTDPAVIDTLEESGLLFYRMGPGRIRFVTNWSTTHADIEAAIKKLL